MKEISTRRSIRTFTNKKISEEVKNKILLAGMSAPSGCARHPVRYMIINDKKVIDTISSLPGKRPIKTSTFNVLVLTDISSEIYNEYWKELWPQDCSASMTTMLLEAHNLGLGGVWGGLYPNEDLILEVRNNLHISENLVPFGIAMMGYTEEPLEVDRKIKKEWIIC